MGIPFKPRNSEAREWLKTYKEGFNDPSLDAYEQRTRWAVWHGPRESVQAYGGEFLHQLALRHHHRGDLGRATRLYQQSMQLLRGNPLGVARTMRDYAALVADTGDESAGLVLADLALHLHRTDVRNEKSRRQRLLTRSYVWRLEIMADRHPEAARRHLVELALGPDFDFYVRDRKVIIDFLIPRTKKKVHRQLLVMQSEIHAELHQPLKVIESQLRLLIDLELSVLGIVTRKLLRRE